MERKVRNKFTALIMALVTISILVTGIRLAYGYDLSIYYYYDRVLEPQAALASIHNDSGHVYNTESGQRPTWEETQTWWKKILDEVPEIKVIMTEKQKHTGMSYEAICILMCNSCGVHYLSDKETYENLEELENEAYKSVIQELLIDGYRVMDSNGDLIKKDTSGWYDEYDRGLYDKRENMKHYIHDPDRMHAYRTESGVKPDYDEAMAWWRNHVETTEDIDQHFTEQQIAGKGMYEYVTELMCMDCTPTKEETEVIQHNNNVGHIEYDAQVAEKAGIGEIYTEENGKDIAELRERAKKLGYTVHKESSQWVDQEDMAEQMRAVVIVSIVIALSLSASVLIIGYIVESNIRKKK